MKEAKSKAQRRLPACLDGATSRDLKDKCGEVDRRG